MQLRARGGHPLTTILELCNKIKSQIEDEQTEKQAEYETEKADCQEIISNLEDEISSAQQKTIDNNKEIQDLQSQLDSYETDLTNAEELKSSKEDQLESLEDIRKQENAVYQAEVDELNEMIQALRDGKSILQTLIYSNTDTGSFFERNHLINKPQSEDLNRLISLFDSKKNGYFKMAKVMMQIVAKQEAGQVDQNLLNDVLELIDELITQLLDNVQTKTETEENRKSTYETQKNNVQAALNSVIANINEIETQINEINNELLNLDQDNIDLENKISSYTTDKEAKESSCTDYYHAYITESQNRLVFNFF